MSYYYKKQEEQKQLEEDNEDAYLNSSWANNKGLKASLQGTENIKMGFGSKKFMWVNLRTLLNRMITINVILGAFT